MVTDKDGKENHSLSLTSSEIVWNHSHHVDYHDEGQELHGEKDPSLSKHTLNIAGNHDNPLTVIPSLNHHDNQLGSNAHNFEKELAETLSDWFLASKSLSSPQNIRDILQGVLLWSHREKKRVEAVEIEDNDKSRMSVDGFVYHLIETLQRRLHEQGVITPPQYFSELTYNKPISYDVKTKSEREMSGDILKDVMIRSLVHLCRTGQAAAVRNVFHRVCAADLMSPSQPVKISLEAFEKVTEILLQDIPKRHSYEGLKSHQQNCIEALDAMFGVMEGEDEYAYEVRQIFFHVLITHQMSELLHRYFKRAVRKSIPVDRRVFHQMIVSHTEVNPRSSSSSSSSKTEAVSHILKQLRQQGSKTVPTSFFQKAESVPTSTLSEKETQALVSDKIIREKDEMDSKHGREESRLTAHGTFDGPTLKTYVILLDFADKARSITSLRAVLSGLAEDNIRPNLYILRDIMRKSDILKDYWTTRGLIQIVKHNLLSKAVHFGYASWQPPVALPGRHYFEKNVIRVSSNPRNKRDGGMSREKGVFPLPDLKEEDVSKLYHDAMINARKCREPNDITEMVKDLRGFGIKLCPHFLKNCMTTYLRCHRPNEVLTMYEDMLRWGVARDLRHATCFVQALAMSGRIKDAQDALQTMESEGTPLFIDAYRTVSSSLLKRLMREEFKAGNKSESVAENEKDMCMSVVYYIRFICEEKKSFISEQFIQELVHFAAVNRSSGRFVANELRIGKHNIYKDIADQINRAAELGVWENVEQKKADLKSFEIMIDKDDDDNDEPMLSQKK
eukprot:CAMPEP_0182439328 /NCGR_PEP_ID=MMETSP1167-20130531/86369_1 /TAXON_ID=2988 /ORGANISM="Mallomonas Sp, Strain CCMP3275" /LENGTH=787 /DNA_ID=CAMNT_0024633003 /DNA_START=674 /DNA_END=3037 /DNA_ORIENTATION=-